MSTARIVLTSKSLKGGIVKGLGAVWASFSYIRQHGELRRFFIIPAIINTILLSAVFYFGYRYLLPLVDLIPEFEQRFLQWLMVVLKPILSTVMIFLIVLVTVFLYSVVGNVIIAPFNDLISEKIERMEGHTDFETPFSLKKTLQDVGRAMGNIFRLLLLLALMTIGLAVLNAIPIAGTVIHAVITFLYTLFMFGFQFLDFPLERRRVSFRDKLRVAWRYRGLTMGLGLGFFVLTFIPVLGFLVTNYLSVATTRVFDEDILPGLAIKGP